MFLSISSNFIHFLGPKGEETLPFFQIEKNFGPRILNVLKKHNPQTLYVLNGPGSFTTLRVCCLALSLIQKHQGITIKTTTKIDLFHDLAMQYGSFPHILGVTIGQKHNCRMLETHNKTITKISYQERLEKNIPHDPVHTLGVLENTYKNMIMHREQNNTQNCVNLCLDQKKRTLDFTRPIRKIVETLAPAYLIDPTMG